MIDIVTEFRLQPKPGFYNVLTYEEAHSSGEVLYGPYESRPLAKIAKIELRTHMETKKVA